MSSYSTKRCAYEGICPRLISDLVLLQENCISLELGQNLNFSTSLVVPGEESEFILSYSCRYLDLFFFLLCQYILKHHFRKIKFKIETLLYKQNKLIFLIQLSKQNILTFLC